MVLSNRSAFFQCHRSLRVIGSYREKGPSVNLGFGFITN